MKRTFLLIFPLLFLITSCNQSSKSKTTREGEPDVYNLTDSDSKMNSAIKEAKNTIGLFHDALVSNNPDYDFFSIKQRFDTPEGGEHIWIQEITIKDSEYAGVLANVPVNIKGVKLGDTIIVDTNNISDWMYLDKGIVKGGFTIKVLRDEMTEDERKAFDSESGLIFE